MENNTVEQSVVMSMDGTDAELYPFLPYILQDFREIGTSPGVVVELIERFSTNYKDLRVLDLGCGKGAVSIELAKRLGCYCHGIDAVQGFIDEAINRARELEVERQCHFECDDIRNRVSGPGNYDIVVLGAIGPVLGDYEETLSSVSSCLREGGQVIVDDCYIADDSEFTDPVYEKRSIVMAQARSAGASLLDEVVAGRNEMATSDERELAMLKRRCLELVEKHPERAALFTDYLRSQEREYRVLETRVTCTTMMFHFA